MSNLYTPERGLDESREDYVARRKAANERPFGNPGTRVVPKFKMSAREKHRKAVALAKPPAPTPKPVKVRVHRQHFHTLRDESNDAFFLVGRNPRRVWLAGESARY